MSLGSFLKKAAKGVVKVGLPVVGTVLGGPLGGAIGGALGGALGSGKPKLGNIALGGAAGGAGGLLAGSGGLGSLMGGATGGAETAGLAGGGTGVLGALGKVGSYALSHPETILGAVGAVSGINASHKADDLQQRALDLANSEWEAGAPLRDAGRTGLLDAAQHPVARTPLPSSNPYAAQYGAQPVPALPVAPAPSYQAMPAAASGPIRSLAPRSAQRRGLRRVGEVLR